MDGKAYSDGFRFFLTHTLPKATRRYSPYSYDLSQQLFRTVCLIIMHDDSCSRPLVLAIFTPPRKVELDLTTH